MQNESMQNERKSSGINIGSASIIMVFSVLCLTVFAVLSLITANSEYELAIKSADVIRDYYSADSSATEKLARVRAEDNLADMQEKAENLGMNSETTDGVMVVSFTEEIDDKQGLSVRVAFTESSFEIQEWKNINLTDWNTSGELWDGELN